jgi:hypothetical protein
MFWSYHALDFLFSDLSTGSAGNHALHHPDTAKKLPRLPHFPRLPQSGAKTVTILQTDPLPPAPQPREDEYPADAVSPRFDELGRRFMPENPYPGVINLPLGPRDVLALSLFWTDAASTAATTGDGEAWSFAETRAAHFLRIAREIQPYCQAAFLSMTREQLEAWAAKRSGGAA